MGRERPSPNCAPTLISNGRIRKRSLITHVPLASVGTTFPEDVEGGLPSIGEARFQESSLDFRIL